MAPISQTDLPTDEDTELYADPGTEPDSDTDDIPAPSPTDDEDIDTGDDTDGGGQDTDTSVVTGELVDVDHDGVPDTEHRGEAAGTEVDERELEEAGVLVPVDAVTAAAKRSSLPELAARKELARRPIVAPWLKEGSQRVAVARWALRYTGHVVAFHAIRVPLYVLRLLGRSPLGFGRVLRQTWVWMWDHEGKPLRTGATDSGDADTYIRLSHQRNDRVKHRAAVVFAAIVPAVLAALAVWSLVLPSGLQVLTALAAACILGAIGSAADKPVIGRAVAKSGTEKLTSDIVVLALGSLGIPKIDKAIASKVGIRFPEPITRDGPGARAVIDLPHGVTADEVIERRKKLASGLRRPLGCVWPEGDRSIHEGRLVLFVGDEDMNKAKQPPWSLAKSGQVDLFAPQPFGTDQRGRWVMVTLMFVAGLIGSIPRMGKTFALRLLLLIAALDPRAELHTYDLKGTGDLDPLAPIAHRHRAGDDPEDIEYAITDMRGVRTELRRRTKVIRSLDRAICPDSKVTPELASKRKLGLHPVVIGVDECQVWFEHKEYGVEFEEICTDLVKRGPATGIVLLLATQRPDSKSIPTGISANAVWRFCLKVMGQLENDMVLGTSQYKNGVRASTFAFADKGIGYMVGEGAAAQIVKTVKADGPTSEKIVARARAVREKLGLLTGDAAGQAMDTEATERARFDVLADVATVFTSTGAEKLWSSVILSQLEALRPDAYTGWTAKALADALKPHGLTVGQVWDTTEEGERKNRNGYTAEAIRTALGKRGSTFADVDGE